jgi:putative N6-adenine-specific DNA methylase
MMQLEDTFVINALTHSKYLNHSKYVALKIKDAIVDQFRSRHDGQRLSIDRHNPTHRLNVHIGRDNLCTLSWDVSGDALNRRGYRTATGEAPINEILAAGIILASNWQKDSDFVDAMCGSGTFLIEAAMIAYNIPPQINRKEFGIMKNKNFDAELWEEVVTEANSKTTDFDHQILGFDKDFKAIKATQLNILAAQLDGKIIVERKDMFKVTPANPQGILIINPPYDERLQIEDVRAFYKDIGHALKHNFTGFNAWIISANIKAMRQLGLRPTFKKILFNGPLECQLAHYELYRGGKKDEELR